jgi:hypothetical protein
MRIMQETSHFEMSVRKGNAFFLLDEGLMGMGHGDIREGDEVWILFGGRLPYVLRRYEDHYQFQRKCYVAGCMFGVTAWESGQFPGRFVKERIEIC